MCCSWAERPDIVVVREPVDVWERPRGGEGGDGGDGSGDEGQGAESLFQRYYSDQKSNAFLFETCVACV